MPGPTFTSHAVFMKTIAAVRESTEEQARIERAIGRTILERLGGKNTDLLTAYKEIGGNDPAVKEVFDDMNPQIAKINIASVKGIAATVVNKPSVAAAKSSSIKNDNPVFKVENTALNTLADLGGPTFAQRYNIK